MLSHPSVTTSSAAGLLTLLSNRYRQHIPSIPYPPATTPARCGLPCMLRITVNALGSTPLHNNTPGDPIFESKIVIAGVCFLPCYTGTVGHFMFLGLCRISFRAGVNRRLVGRKWAQEENQTCRNPIETTKHQKNRNREICDVTVPCEDKKRTTGRVSMLVVVGR